MTPMNSNHMTQRTLGLAAVAAVVSGVGLAVAGLQIGSTAFPANGSIPAKYTCDGPGLDPPLAFSSVRERPELIARYERSGRQGRSGGDSIEL